ncbi:hypothetical protein TWF730_004822 [Orbilia blumenaviensis]|uniref:NACHT domain-containing protein n=1 Tax=Orbilia blumenaviensis TaxID=1796055 RepID=A0AAV9TZ55_9PEZI
MGISVQINRISIATKLPARSISYSLGFPNHSQDTREKVKAKEREILRILDKSPYQDRKDRNPDRIHGTCEWFVGHRLFKEWQENKTPLSRTLWVSADPGCGKSVLAKYLIDSILPTTESRTTCYFFFKDDFEDQRSAITALCCILRQIFIQRRILLSESIIEQFEITSDPKGFTNSFSRLWDALLSTANDKNAGQIVCILDAFDECESNGRSQLAQALCALYGTKKNPNSNLKFLLTSRPYGEIRRGFQTQILGIPGLPVIHLSGENEAEMTKISDEIDIFIKARVQDIGARLKLKLEEEEFLLEKLMRVPNRTYLWAYLILDLVQSDIYINKNGIARVTSHLPKTVDEAYEKIISKSHDFKKTRRLLQIVVAAARPLTLKEMSLALALKGNPEESYQSKTYSNFYFESEERFHEIVRDLCGLFVTIINSRIYLLHQTAKEFLVRSDLTSSPKRTNRKFQWKHSLRLLESHQVLARACIQYLLFSKFNVPPLYKDAVPRYTEDHVFLDYSANHWTTHVLESQMEANNATARSILKLCDSKSQRCLIWLMVYWASQNTDFPNGFTSLMIASYFGLTKAMKIFLESDDPGLNLRDDTHGRSALSWATGSGYNSAVELLVNINRPWWGMGKLYREKVQIDSVDTYGRTPLIYAVWNNNVTAIKLLLNAGASVDLEDRVGGTPLSYAICGGNDKVVGLILRNGTKVDSKKSIIQKLFISSMKKNDKDVSKLLLDTEMVDPDLEDTDGIPPLSWAIKHRSLAILQLLIARGAKLDICYPAILVSE